jgi:hypothetical protein
MGTFAAGQVVIVHFPFSDLTASKLRPAVKLDFSETLTPEAQRGFAEAVEKIQELCR